MTTVQFQHHMPYRPWYPTPLCRRRVIEVIGSWLENSGRAPTRAMIRHQVHVHIWTRGDWEGALDQLVIDGLVEELPGMPGPHGRGSGVLIYGLTPAGQSTYSDIKRETL